LLKTDLEQQNKYLYLAMHGVGNYLIFLIVFKAIQYLISSLTKDDSETALTDDRKGTFHYIYNGKKINKSFIVYAYEVLDINMYTPISPEKIYQAYYKQLEFAEEDIIMGYKVKHISEDLNAARDYLLDYYDYVQCRN
jgi:hypothetical protein